MNFDLYKRGLTSEEAKKRLEKYGLNKIPEAKKKSLLTTFLSQFCNPLIYLLVFGAVFSFCLGEFTDSIFIAIILIMNAIIGTVQETSAEKSAESLKDMVKSKAIVIRDGDEDEIDSELLVPGDLVVLKEGTKVPADITLLFSDNLEVNESMLTGESLPVKKDANYEQKENCILQEKFNEVFAGTIIIKGIAYGKVEKTGLNTEIGKIACKLTSNNLVQTPLLIRMEKFTKTLAIGIGIAIIFILIIAILRGESIKETIMMAITLCVAAVPESLPITTTIVLAIGTSKMAKHNVIVRHLSAVESLGSCTVIASDKTGTLTMNEMTVNKIIDYDGDEIEMDSKDRIINKTGLLYEEKTGFLNSLFGDKNNEYLKMLFLSMVLPNEAKSNLDGFFGDAVDVAFLKFVEKNGYSVSQIFKKYANLKMIYYTSENMCSASINKIDDKYYLFIKGAPEKILSMCERNKINFFNFFKRKPDYEKVEEEFENLSKNGYRVLAVGCKEIEEEDVKDFDLKNLNDIEFLALVGMIDPLKDEVKDAIKECQSAGINIVMITGDNPKTAFNIGKELGFVKNQDEVKTGVEVRETLEEGKAYLDNLTKNTKIYSRMEPTQKLDIVQSLIRNGNFVAVTGDGVNDAPALKNAHVGVAMGKIGTDIAKESADIILMDDNFTSIVYAIKAGRVTYNNIRKLIFFAVSSGIPKIIFFIIAIFMRLPIPFNPVQLLWLNVMTEGIQDIFLAFEDEEGGEMNQKPRSPKEPIFDSRMKKRCGIFVAFNTVLTTLIYYLSLKVLHYSPMKASTIVLTLIVFLQNMQVLNSRSETKSVFKHSFKNNKKVLIGILCAVGIHLLAVNSLFMDKVLRIEKLNFVELSFLFIVATSIIFISEIEKKFHNK